MANYEMIGVKMGFDSTEVTKGTQKAKGDVDKLKQSLGPISEQLGKWGLSFVAPLAAVGKLTQAVIAFGKNSEASANDAERALYKLTTTFDGISDSIVAATGRGVGKVAQFGDMLGENFNKWWNWQLELIGAQEKGTGKLLAEYAKANAEQDKFIAVHRKQLEEIARLEQRSADDLEKRKSATEQLVNVRSKIAQQAEIMANSDEKSDEYLNAKIEKLKLEISQRDLLAKANSEFAAAEKENAANKEKQQKAIEAALDATFKGLDAQSEELKKQVLIKGEIIESTNAQVGAEESLTAEIEKQNRLKTGQQSGWKGEAGREMVPYLQSGETRVIQKIGRSGADYESQDMYDLTQVLKNLKNELENQLDFGRENAIERRNNWLASMVENEIRQVEIAIENKKALERYNERKMAWDEANSVKNLSNDEKMLSLTERVAKRLDSIDARFNAAGLTTTPKVNT